MLYVIVILKDTAEFAKLYKTLSFIFQAYSNRSWQLIVDGK